MIHVDAKREAQMRIASTLLIFVLIAMLLPTVAVHAQDDDTDWCEPPYAESIAYGETKTGSIDNEYWTFSYCFDATVGDLVEIQLSATSGDLDTLVGIFEETFTDLLASNDDINEGNRNSGLTFDVPTTGRYLIAVTRYDLGDGTTTGDYELTILLANPTPNPTPDTATTPPTETAEDNTICGSPSAVLMRIGETQTGSISNDQFVVGHCWFAEAGDVVQISATATSGDLDPRLLITDPTLATVFAENDDIGLGNSNSQLEFTVPERGRYVAAVTRFQEAEGLTTGDFVLNIVPVALAPRTALGSFGVDLTPLGSTIGTTTTTTTTTTTADLCNDSPTIAELAASTWVPLDGSPGRYQFACDGTVTYIGGASADNGTYTLDGETLTMDFGFQTVVWNEFLLVAGLVTAIDGNGVDVFYIPLE